MRRFKLTDSTLATIVLGIEDALAINADTFLLTRGRTTADDIAAVV